jgi:hypothetical protein
VLALKQDFIRTKELVNDLARHGVDHLLIPEYNLSHYLKSATKLFIGAVSVSADNQAVTGVGTANVGQPLPLVPCAGLPVCRIDQVCP